MAPSAKRIDAAMNELRSFGLRLPETHTKTPWPGHLDLAVKGKTYAFMSTSGEPFSITCKLPQSGVAALMFPFASPAAYGLGKSGWVNARFEPGVVPPGEVLQVFREWIEESYRATAPKKLVAAIGGNQPATAGGKAQRRDNKARSKSKSASVSGAPTKRAARTARKAAAEPKRAAKTPKTQKTKKKAAQARRK